MRCITPSLHMHNRLWLPSTAVDPSAISLTDFTCYWKLDEASGTRNDSSANAQHLTDNNSVGSASGVKGNAATFASASSQSLSHADSATLQSGDIQMTWVVWVNLTTKTAIRPILEKIDATKLEYGIYYDNSIDRFVFFVSTDGANVAASATANNFGSPSTGTWYCIRGWHDSVGNKVGIQVGSGTANTTSYSGGITARTGGFYLGVNGNFATAFMNGSLDECAIWKRLLTDAEWSYLIVGRTYNSGTGKFE